MKFLLLEQKYLECIEDGRNQEALECLRSEITPLNYKKEKLPKICRYIWDFCIAILINNTLINCLFVFYLLPDTFSLIHWKNLKKLQNGKAKVKHLV